MLASLSAMNGGPTKAVRLTQAQAVVIGSVRALDRETVALGEALGRVIREDAVSDSMFPPCDLSAMDGYCMAAADAAGASPSSPARFRVAGTIKAGDVPAARLRRGECTEIMTGAALPEGADTVVPREIVRQEGGSIALSAPSPVGAFVRRRGKVVVAGERIGLEGRRASPQVMALLDTLGIGRVSVARKPRVGVIATGDELLCEGMPTDPYHIRPSNLTMLTALVRSAGCLPAEARTSGDSESEIVEAIDACGECDAVVMSGGVAGGRFDLVKNALSGAGAVIRFDEVKMRPGRRTVFATRDKMPFFCLPGNPLAAFVSFQAIALPGLLAMQGLKDPSPEGWFARLGGPIRVGGEDGWTTFVPGRTVAGPAVEPTEARETGDLVSLAGATCLIVLDSAASVSAGEFARVWPIPEGAVP